MPSGSVVPRVPDPTNPKDKNRMVRFTEKVSGIFNSLFRRGLLVFKGGSDVDWSITIDALSGRGPPPASLGEPGMVYFDVSDPMNLQFYWKT